MQLDVLRKTMIGKDPKAVVVKRYKNLAKNEKNIEVNGFEETDMFRVYYNKEKIGNILLEGGRIRSFFTISKGDDTLYFLLLCSNK